jgi:putative permease
MPKNTSTIPEERMAGGQGRHIVHLAAIFIALFALILLLFLGGVAEIVAVAALLAYVLNPVVTRLEYRGMPRGVASAIVLIAIACLVAVGWYIFSPIAIDQLRALQAGGESSQASRALNSLQTLLRDRFDFLGLGSIDLQFEFQKAKNTLVQRASDVFLEGSFSILIGVVMTPFVMFFLLKDGSLMKKYFISLVPNRYFEFTMDLFYKMDMQLGNYLRGQFIDALVFGLLATLTLWILGVPYFVFIGIFAGLANLIPFVGPIAGALAAIVPAILEQGDVLRAVYVVIAFGVLKLIDDFVVQPLAVGKTVNLHPMVVAIGIVVAGHLFGIIGMLLVVPLLGFLRVVLEESVETYRKYRFD